ncbi:DUF481 domain-containing protein [Tenacibaculum jejuense]|uniref:Salt-induced outer membrane protein n=1 Tax=Tenacibaculum jejuense TaxID=584609 RepID=A0A238U3W8_9FLAO|nr:DUF481 domain-containing protein [Tenacibaculum jejuense]SNR13827.1 Protein of unknown function [Tenacibaculum jejuense]
MKKRILILILVFPFTVFSQVINVENLRRVTDTVGWSGFARLDLHLIKNRNTIFGFSNRIRVQYRTNKHLWLFVNDLDFREANSNKLVSKNSQHLRYNYRFSEKTALEAFLQSQENEIAAIRFRGLVGVGLRFKLSKSEKYKLYFGNAVMYENEKVIESDQKITNRDWRSSSYFSMSLFPTNTISIASTTYFQPRFDLFSDFRISSQTTMSFRVVKNLRFATTLTYQYDEFPVLGIPKEQYRLTNGLMYSF